MNKTNNFSQNKYILTLLAISILFVTVSQVSAANEHANSHAENPSSNSQKDTHDIHSDADDTVTPTSAPATVSPTGTTVTPTANQDNDCDDQKNHGQFVSCIAHEHEGGQVISVAARSQTGKKHDDDNDADDATPTVSVTVTPSVSPTITPTDTPSITPTDTATPSPTITDTVTPTVTPGATTQDAGVIAASIKTLISELKNLLKSFSSLLHH